MNYVEKYYYDVADIYDKEQEELREKVKRTIKDGYNNIPKMLDCCYNCDNFSRNCSICNSDESPYTNQEISNVLNQCYYFDKITEENNG